MPFELSSLLHSGYFHPVLRKWQEVESRVLCKESLVYPVFICDDADAIEVIPTMPGQKRYGVNRIKEEFAPLVAAGLKTVLIFGVPSSAKKDGRGTPADDPNGPAIQAVKVFRKEFPQLLVACDVCLCPYTDHGHCGILRESGLLDIEASIQRLAEVALAYAQAGKIFLFSMRFV